MSKFKLTLCNSTSEYDLYFNVDDTVIAKKWAKEISNNYPLFETERFSNWPKTTKNADYFVTKLNQCIDTVNDYKAGTILTKVSLPFNQSTMNYLHKFFEELRGTSDLGTAFYNSAPETVRHALNEFNIVIHEYEHFAFNERTVKITNHPYATIVGTFHRPRFLLEDSDYNYFTYNWEFGRVYINYCEVGKPLLDVFKDNDIIVGESNIKPLQYYSADFQIKFGLATLPDVYKKRTEIFNTWFSEREEFFKKLGIVKGPKLALGLIPVAAIDLELSNLEGMSQIGIVNKLSQYQQIKAVCIK
jgi:hypothetical protein